MTRIPVEQLAKQAADVTDDTDRDQMLIQLALCDARGEFGPRRGEKVYRPAQAKTVQAFLNEWWAS